MPIMGKQRHAIPHNNEFHIEIGIFFFFFVNIYTIFRHAHELQMLFETAAVVVAAGATSLLFFAISCISNIFVRFIHWM